MRLTIKQKKSSNQWFQALQKEICLALEALEKKFHPQGHLQIFQKKNWKRPGGGGGTMAILEGRLFEKAGVNVSEVFGSITEKKADNKKNQSFWASGLSVVIHPVSPFIPIIHMNTRIMEHGKAWFGGGIDLTPIFPNTKETKSFHAHLESVCSSYDAKFYPQFKEAADQYFFLAHRNEPRGVGGIFYDDLSLSFEKGLAFSQSIGKALIALYKPIIKTHWRKIFSTQDKKIQLKKRARYVEFNLLYDKGTLFGLQTKGCIDAIFMSLPPLASWPSPIDSNH